MKLHDERRDYERAQLRRAVLNDDPFKQFADWFSAAKASGLLVDPTAFTLATVSREGQPHQRIVLLKDVDTEGFIFYTNYASQKGQDVEANPHVAMHFAWLPLEQQIRVEGRIEKIDQASSEAYFQSRPRASQLGALASAQSSPIATRDELEARYHQLTEEYEGQPVPMPKTWGGYRIKPSLFEFWQGGKFRLHDRFIYRLQEDRSWLIERLQP
ncbi:pyridoxamine 5'-phosphate oxidase [Pseudidiomarina homiensis]|uniref:pyridoxamine 5'-phosphate oxidase n=1 Tax=Pseudidiomarina homiensis TaxID=364198 RepID=UPI00215B4D80|nr:pyridoxamine 5'-phosphate oxidase [Pseudidiomarina homiensis]